MVALKKIKKENSSFYINIISKVNLKLKNKN